MERERKNKNSTTLLSKTSGFFEVSVTQHNRARSKKNVAVIFQRCSSIELFTEAVSKHFRHFSFVIQTHLEFGPKDSWAKNFSM